MNSIFTEKFPIDKLIPYEKNPRKISQKAIDVVSKSIEMNGALDPIEIDDEGIILAGHTRAKAYRELGYTEAPVIQHIGLTDIQKRTYRIAANKTAEYSEWNDELLTEELKNIDMNIERLIDSTGIVFNEIPFDENKIKEEYIKPYRKIHCLITIPIDKHEIIEKIKSILTEDIEIEIASN